MCSPSAPPTFFGGGTSSPTNTQSKTAATTFDPNGSKVPTNPYTSDDFWAAHDAAARASTGPIDPTSGTHLPIAPPVLSPNIAPVATTSVPNPAARPAGIPVIPATPATPAVPGTNPAQRATPAVPVTARAGQDALRIAQQQPQPVDAYNGLVRALPGTTASSTSQPQGNFQSKGGYVAPTITGPSYAPGTPQGNVVGALMRRFRPNPWDY